MPSETGFSGFSKSVQWLLASGKRIRIFPERDLRTCRAEIVVLDTPPVQRLRKIRQLGLASLVFPTAEHSRFSHSLGVLYWTAKLYDSLRVNYFRERNVKLLDQMQAGFGSEISISLIGRLYGLLHDITHIPFGHTLEDQFGIFPRHDEDRARIDICFARLYQALPRSPILTQFDSSGDVLESLLLHLKFVRAIMEIDRATSSRVDPNDISFDGLIAEDSLPTTIPTLLFLHDLVSNTLCADLIDYSLRDSLFASIPKAFDKVLLAYLAIFELPTPKPLARFVGRDTKVFRFGINAVRKKLRHDVITGVMSLLRCRYELAERVYYHHAKCAADAMLDRIVRAVKDSLPDSTVLVGMGDEDFLTFVGKAIADSGISEAVLLLEDFESRRLYKEVYRISGAHALTPKAHELMEQTGEPAGRTSVEQALTDQLSGLNAYDIIVSPRPRKMQMKQADALIGWVDGKCYSLASLADQFNYAKEVKELTARYAELWSFSVYISSRKLHMAGRVIEKCESDEFFAMANDESLQSYLNKDQRIPWKTHEAVDEIRNEALDRALTSVAARGKLPDIRQIYRECTDATESEELPSSSKPEAPAKQMLPFQSKEQGTGSTEELEEDEA